jgi:hypothetical protein
MTAAHLGASAACVRSANAETLESGYCSRCLCVIGPMTDNLRQSSHPIDFGRGGAQIDMTSAIDIEGGLRARYRQPAGVEQFGIEAVPEELKTAGWFDLFSIMFNLSMCMLAGRRWWAWHHSPRCGAARWGF